MTVPPRLTLPNMINIAMKQRWAWGMLATKRRAFGNLMGHVEGVDNLNNLMKWIGAQFDLSLNWADIEWIKERWGGPLILKGILDPEDARLAVETGADAIVVSNHGGRQLDGALSSIRMLPHIVDAVGKSVEIHMDGGIRSGQDVLKALSLGAQGTYIGRSYVYGLGAQGKKGVTKALELIAKELDHNVGFVGQSTIHTLSKDNLLLNNDFLNKYSNLSD
jgi:L-lactate dehydrogenase (cytochrome)